MGNTLFDQLKKSGLIDKKKATQAKKEKHKRIKQQKGKKAKALVKSKQWVQEAQAKKVARDRKLNQQRKQAAEQKAVTAQIKQLIQANRLEDIQGEIGYNFVDGKQVQRLYVTSAVQDQLTKGSLAIVKEKEKYIYELVPAQIADKIKLRDPSCVILCNVTQSRESDADDPYAEYQVPDDLMW
jgi:uncharacterized protein YaiL (DUF2058 family)